MSMVVGSTGPVLSSWMRYHGLVALMTLAAFGAVAISSWITHRSSPAVFHTASVEVDVGAGSKYGKKPPVEVWRSKPVSQRSTRKLSPSTLERADRIGQFAYLETVVVAEIK